MITKKKRKLGNPTNEMEECCQARRLNGCNKLQSLAQKRKQIFINASGGGNFGEGRSSYTESTSNSITYGLG